MDDMVCWLLQFYLGGVVAVVLFRGSGAFGYVDYIRGSGGFGYGSLVWEFIAIMVEEIKNSTVAKKSNLVRFHLFDFFEVIEAPTAAPEIEREVETGFTIVYFVILLLTTWPTFFGYLKYNIAFLSG